MIQIREILVPTDFSEPADAALAYAKGLASQFGSRIHLLHVIGTPQVGWAAESATFSWPTLLADLETDARAQLERHRSGLALDHRLMLLEHVSRRSDRLRGPLQGLIVDG